MLHGNAFVQFLNEGGNRAAQQAGSINWAMAMARRRAGSGRVGLRGMFSLEPWTIRGCGYPDLLATGEVCNGEPIHDRQHPHDLIMELAAEYSRPLARRDTVADLRRPCRRAGARACRLPASHVGHAESAGADLTPLARRHPHHLRRRHGRHLGAHVEGRGLGVQRPGARRPSGGSRSRAARFRVRPAVVPADAAAGAADLCGPSGGSRSRPLTAAGASTSTGSRHPRAISARSGTRGNGHRRWRSAATASRRSRPARCSWKRAWRSANATPGSAGSSGRRSPPKTSAFTTAPRSTTSPSCSSATPRISRSGAG